MINTECQECHFSNSCPPYDQRSQKYNCKYLLDFEIVDDNGDSGILECNGTRVVWSGVSYRRYTQKSLDAGDD